MASNLEQLMAAAAGMLRKEARTKRLFVGTVVGGPGPTKTARALAVAPTEGETRTDLPQRLAVTLRMDEVDQHREITCDRYENCIEWVAARGWPSFTCQGCTGFKCSDPTIKHSEVTRGFIAA